MTISPSETDEQAPASTSEISAPDMATPPEDSKPASPKNKKTAPPGKPRPGQGTPPRHYYGRTFRDIVQFHPRTEPERLGIPGFTIRELCSTLHVAAESLRTAYDEPGRLSLTGLMALAEKMNEDPLRVAADLFAEIRYKQQIAAEKAAEKPKPVKRARLSKKKPADQSEETPGEGE